MVTERFESLIPEAFQFNINQCRKLWHYNLNFEYLFYFLNTIGNKNLCLITFKRLAVFRNVKTLDFAHGGEMMDLSSKERMMTFAVVGLCVVIGVMSLLAVVYYSQANGIQGNYNSKTAELQSVIDQLQSDKSSLETEFATVQSQRTSLQNEVTSLNTQIETLDAEIASLTADKEDLTNQVNSLTTDNDALTAQVNSLTAERDALTEQVNTLTAEKTALTEQVNSLTAQVSQLEGTVARLQDQVDALYAAVQKLMARLRIQ
jgi:peptidoglycan hydrolase CwlO-like protein